MLVSSLHVYPVKSTAPTDLSRAEVERCGLAGDRRWLVVDPDGVQMTARERRRLLLARAVLSDSAVTLTGPHADDLVLYPEQLDGPRTTAEVWRTRFPVLDAGAAAARWFSELLDEPARLVHLDDPNARPLTHPSGQPGEVVSTADSHPLLLTTTASLAQLNDWIAEGDPDGWTGPLPMRRFRPNVVIDSDRPFAEDDWQQVQIGDVTFRADGGCARCVLTTIDPDTLVGGKEPIRTLARRHSWDRKTFFGINLAPTTLGSIRVGDEVRVVA